MASVLDTVRGHLARHLDRDPGTIPPEARLQEDLGLHSISALDLVIDLEEEYDLELDDGELVELATVADVVRLVESRRRAASSG